MAGEKQDPGIEERSINQVPGFLCPNCKKVHIKISLPQFLGSSSIACPVCGTTFDMDKSECAGLISALQDLNVATENVRALQKE